MTATKTLRNILLEAHPDEMYDTNRNMLQAAIEFFPHDEELLNTLLSKSDHLPATLKPQFIDYCKLSLAYLICGLLGILGIVFALIKITLYVVFCGLFFMCDDSHVMGPFNPTNLKSLFYWIIDAHDYLGQIKSAIRPFCRVALDYPDYDFGDEAGYDDFGKCVYCDDNVFCTITLKSNGYKLLHDNPRLFHLPLDASGITPIAIILKALSEAYITKRKTITIEWAVCDQIKIPECRMLNYERAISYVMNKLHVNNAQEQASQTLQTDLDDDLISKPVVSQLLSFFSSQDTKEAGCQTELQYVMKLIG